MILQKSSKTYLNRYGLLVALFLIGLSACFLDRHSNSPNVRIISDSQGYKLLVDGEDFMISGMNWDYYPIGTNYSFYLWAQPDSIIRSALSREMTLLQDMGVNTIRQYPGIPPNWVQYIYEEYGIYTVLNHSLGRYGIEIDGSWRSPVDYSDPAIRTALLNEISRLVEEFKDVPGVLMWLVGNENNYGLFWESAETSDIPDEDPIEEQRAHQMYSLFNEAINMIHDLDPYRPVGIANGDLLFLDILAEEIEHLDYFGANVYRGVSFTDLFDRLAETMDLPILLTEFGADAFNAREMREDQLSQARYLVGNWQEIYEQSYGKGKTGRSIGGFTFQFSDGWWKYGQTSQLEVHDTHASWANPGYMDDFESGKNNMNEEWFGICAKGRANQSGLYELYPRVAYYALQKIHALDPYSQDLDVDGISAYFNSIDYENLP